VPAPSPWSGVAPWSAVPSPRPAELDAETVDQEEISQDRFTLVALDALEGYGRRRLHEVKLWSRRADELASESLYAA